MRAVLYDIHGNLPALEAALADASRRGATGFVLGGDYAGLGGWPTETLARLRELDAIWLRGNWERWTAHPDQALASDLVQGGIAWVRDRLGDDTVAELAALPDQRPVDDVRFCHASPVSDMRSFAPMPADDEGELLAGVQERRVVFGHTHLAFARRSADGVALLNPGSVGLPYDGDPRAAYALWHDDGRLEQRRVPYDHRGAAAGLRERARADWAETIADRLERAAL